MVAGPWPRFRNETTKKWFLYTSVGGRRITGTKQQKRLLYTHQYGRRITATLIVLALRAILRVLCPHTGGPRVNLLRNRNHGSGTNILELVYEHVLAVRRERVT